MKGNNKINSSFSSPILNLIFLFSLIILINLRKTEAKISQRISKPFSQFDNLQLSQIIKEDEEQIIQNILDEENNAELVKEKLEEALLVGMIIPNRYQRAIIMKRGSLGPRPLRFGR
uniref:Uncharacterized protein n=1 Tax=Meloidogyne enterolobii TaxID=390850 RepID=A0A6V7UZL8_MELEN|nr:unnamed protein product [Meloidogyne enterolobii]